MEKKLFTATSKSTKAVLSTCTPIQIPVNRAIRGKPARTIKFQNLILVPKQISHSAKKIWRSCEVIFYFLEDSEFAEILKFSLILSGLQQLETFYARRDSEKDGDGGDLLFLLKIIASSGCKSNTINKYSRKILLTVGKDFVRQYNIDSLFLNFQFSILFCAEHTLTFFPLFALSLLELLLLLLLILPYQSLIVILMVQFLLLLLSFFLLSTSRKSGFSLFTEEA